MQISKPKYIAVRLLVALVVIGGGALFFFSSSYANKYINVLGPTILNAKDSAIDTNTYDYGLSIKKSGMDSYDLKDATLKIYTNCYMEPKSIGFSWDLKDNQTAVKSRYQAQVLKKTLISTNSKTKWEVLDKSEKVIESGTILAPTCNTVIPDKAVSITGPDKKSTDHDTSYEYNLKFDDKSILGSKVEIKFDTNCNGFGSDNNGNFGWDFVVSELQLKNGNTNFGNYLYKKYISKDSTLKYKIYVNGTETKAGEINGPRCQDNLSKRKLFVDNPKYEILGNDTKITWNVRKVNGSLLSPTENKLSIYTNCENFPDKNPKYNGKFSWNLKFEENSNVAVVSALLNTVDIDQNPTQSEWTLSGPKGYVESDVVRAPSCVVVPSGFIKSTFSPENGTISTLPHTFSIKLGSRVENQKMVITYMYGPDSRSTKTLVKDVPIEINSVKINESDFEVMPTKGSKITVKLASKSINNSDNFNTWEYVSHEYSWEN